MSDTAPPVLSYVDQADFVAMVQKLSQLIARGAWQPDFIVGIGRGGLVPAVYISHLLQIPMLSIDHSSKVAGFADNLLQKVAHMRVAGSRMLLIDDINDSGGTINYVRKVLGEALGAGGLDGDDDDMRFAVLIDNASSQAKVEFAVQAIDRTTDKRWFVFPWEAVMTADKLAEEAAEVPERLS
jgi:hypoxanthine phosphoribosyltransferase